MTKSDRLPFTMSLMSRHDVDTGIVEGGYRRRQACLI
jgi:hypothetical protein